MFPFMFFVVVVIFFLNWEIFESKSDEFAAILLIKQTNKKYVVSVVVVLFNLHEII